MDQTQQPAGAAVPPVSSAAVPMPIKVVGWLMIVVGIIFILLGIPLLVLLGLGALYIVAGAFTVKYGRAVLRLQRKGYVGARVLQIINIVLALLSWSIDGFRRVDYTGLITLAVAVVVLVVLQKNKQLFTN